MKQQEVMLLSLYILSPEVKHILQGLHLFQPTTDKIDDAWVYLFEALSRQLLS